MKKIILLLLAIGSIAAAAQTVNPKTQIRWPAGCVGAYVPGSDQCQPEGTAANPASPSGGVQINMGGNFGTTTDLVYNSANAATQMRNLTTKLPRADVTHPDFGIGQPISSITLSGTCTGTTTYTVTFADTTATVGVGAIAVAGCYSGSLYVDAMVQEGEGYDSNATCSTGVSGVACAVTLKGTAQVADPTGLTGSASAIQQAVDWARTKGKTSTTGPWPCVYIPQGYYTIDAPIDLNGVDCIEGDGPNSTFLSPSGDFPVFTALGQYHYTSTSGGTNLRIRGLHIVANGASSNTGAIEGGYLITAKMDDLAIENSGGYGIGTDEHSERNVLEDIAEANLRIANLSYGNESWYINVNPQNIGITAGGVSYSINNINGANAPASWSNTALDYAQSDGDGYALFTGVYTGTSALHPGNWVNIAGITDLTALNSNWQIVSVFNGCTLTSTQVTPPFSSITSCPGTSTAGYVTVLVQLQTGLMIPGPDWTTPIYQSTPTTVSVAEGVATIASGTFKPALWPTYNPYWLIAGEQFHVIRSSMKSSEYTGGPQFFGRGAVEGNYIEAPTADGLSIGQQIGGASPYFYNESTLPATTTASIYAPLVITDSGHTHGRLRSYYHTPTWLNDFEGVVAFMCSDYNPASTAACANHPTIQQNQYELVEMVQDESATNSTDYIIKRMYTGSTVSAAVAWVPGDIIGFPNGLQAEGSVVTETLPHINTIIAQNDGQIVSMASDQSYFPSAGVMVGPIWDGKVNFPPGTTGQVDAATSFTFNEYATNTSGYCSLYEAQGYNCFKAIGYGNITRLGTMSNGTQVAEPLANILNCEMFKSGTYGGVIVHFDATHWSAGTITDDATHTIMVHPSDSTLLGTAGCKFLGVTTNMLNYLPMAIETYGGYSITDPSGDSLAIVPGENSKSRSLSYTPAGAPEAALAVTYNSSNQTTMHQLGRPCVATADQPLCPAADERKDFAWWNATSAANISAYVHQMMTFSGAGTTASPVTGITLTDLLVNGSSIPLTWDASNAYAEIKFPGWTTAGGNPVLTTSSATPSGTCTSSGYITATVYIGGVATTVKLATC